MSLFDSGDKLEFDVDALRKLKTEVDQRLDGEDGIRAQHKALLDNVNELRSKWQTSASNDFFKNLDDDWDNQMTVYEQTLENLSEVIEKICNEYSGISASAAAVVSTLDGGIATSRLGGGSGAFGGGGGAGGRGVLNNADEVISAFGGGGGGTRGASSTLGGGSGAFGGGGAGGR